MIVEKTIKHSSGGLFMKLSGNTVLITGGSTGIGLSLAESFLAAGNEVLICGRREDRLLDVQKKHPDIHIKVCDVSNENDRRSLVEWATENFNNLNMVINNAGIQQSIDFTKGTEELIEGENEIEINLVAPIYLSAMFIPFLSGKKESAIINVSSGLAITPGAGAPIYCATKSGLHTFTKCLRQQLSGTSIKVFEVLPPNLPTELNPKGRAKEAAKSGNVPFCMSTEDYVASVMKGIENDEFEILNPYLDGLKNTVLAQLDQVFEQMNGKWN